MNLAIRRKTKASLLLNNDGSQFFVTPTEQDIASTITWTGTTPPSSPVALKYNWSRVGKVVTVQFRLEYGVAASSVTIVTIDKPSDLPNPAAITGWGNSEFGIVGTGGLTLAFATLGAAPNAILQKDAGGTYQFRLGGSSGNHIGACGTFTYISE